MENNLENKPDNTENNLNNNLENNLNKIPESADESTTPQQYGFTPLAPVTGEVSHPGGTNKLSATPLDEKPWNNNSILLLVLLLLTFFTPLGAILFVPMLIVGFFSAFSYINVHLKSQRGQPMTSKTVAFQVIRVILALGLAFVVLVLTFIGIVFIGIATGTIDFRMGS